MSDEQPVNCINSYLSSIQKVYIVFLYFTLVNICENFSSNHTSQRYIGRQLINLFIYSFLFVDASYLRQK